jgi:hypothetical protein
LLFPRLNRSLITLGGLLDGFLLTIPEMAKQTAAMGWMITHPKLLLNHLCHSRRRPDLSTKTEGFGSLLQQGR